MVVLSCWVGEETRKLGIVILSCWIREDTKIVVLSCWVKESTKKAIEWSSFLVGLRNTQNESIVWWSCLVG